MKKVNIEDRITRALTELSVRPSLSGFPFLKESILYLIEQYPRHPMLSSELYPYIADAFGTNEKRVERAMRKAIESAFRAVSFECARKHYFSSSFELGWRPTVGDFIDRDYKGNEYGRGKQVARCGNAVCPPMAEAVVRANYVACDIKLTTMMALERMVAV